MRHSFKILMGLAVLAFLAAPAGPVFAAAQNVQGAVFDVGTTTTDPFAGRCAQHRFWSPQNNGSTGINPNSNCPTTGTGACSLGLDTVSRACNRSWLSNAAGSGFPGFFSLPDNMSAFDPSSNGPYDIYALWDNAKNLGTANFISYYYAVGQRATAGEQGRFQEKDCSGTIQVSCFLPGTDDNPPNRNGGDRTNTRLGTVANEGGLAAIPVPRVSGVSGGVVSLNWDAFQYFAEAGAANPFLHYRLSRCVDNNANNVCDAPTDTAPCWTTVGNFTGTSTTDSPGAGDCAFYSIGLVFDGPDAATSGLGAATGEITNMTRGMASQGASLSPSAATIIDFDAVYVGKNTFRVTWTGAVEAGTVGYYLTRSSLVGGPYSRVTDFVPARGDGSAYEAFDRVKRNEGPNFFYQLELVQGDGTSLTNSPIQATLPSAGKGPKK